MPAYYTWAFTDCIYYYKQAQPATQAAASKYNFKLPFAGGHSWICTAQANDPGDSGHQGDNYYSLDFVRSGWPKVNQDVDVFAMHGGKVVEVFSGPLDSTKGASYGGFPANGFFVRVDMDGDNNKKTGFVTVYCHLKYPPMWRVGDTIKAGDWVGYMGTTGHSTGEHLHLTFKYDGNGQYPQSEVEKVLIEGIGIRSFRTGKTYTSTRS